MEIRLLRAGDAQAYWDLRLEALERDEEAFSSAAEDHRNLSLDEIKRRLGPDPSYLFVVGAFDGKRLVGTAGFFREKGRKSAHKGRVWGVYVTKEFQGKGFGRSMMKEVLERASAIEGLEQIQISVATTQEPAWALYRSLGFESWGREPMGLKVGGRYIDEEHMVLFVHRPPGR